MLQQTADSRKGGNRHTALVLAAVVTIGANDKAHVQAHASNRDSGTVDTTGPIAVSQLS